MLWLCEIRRLLKDSNLDDVGFRSNRSTGELQDKARDVGYTRSIRQRGGRQLAGFDTLDIHRSAFTRPDMPPLLEI
jgi:hypothetical protein